MSTAVALVLLFLVLPFAVAGAVIAFVSWRGSAGPAPIRTSDLLATGEPATAEILASRHLGSFVEVRPMARLTLRVDMGTDRDRFDLEVTQSFSRGELRALGVGSIVDVRVSADRTAAAIVPGARD